MAIFNSKVLVYQRVLNPGIFQIFEIFLHQKYLYRDSHPPQKMMHRKKQALPEIWILALVTQV